MTSMGTTHTSTATKSIRVVTVTITDVGQSKGEPGKWSEFGMALGFYQPPAGERHATAGGECRERTENDLLGGNLRARM